jgi:hypothetical protein
MRTYVGADGIAHLAGLTNMRRLNLRGVQLLADARDV